MPQKVFTILLVLTGLFAGATQAAVENFRLLDHQGNSHELYRQSDVPLLIIMGYQSNCPTAIEAAAALAQITKDYPDLVRAWLIDPVQADTRLLLENSHAPLPVLMDTAQLISQGLSMSTTGETLVIDTRDWAVRYRTQLGKEPTTTLQLEAAITALSADEEPADTGKRPNGSKFTYVVADEAPVYSKDIVPILQKYCLPCHVKGDVGPFTMDRHRRVKGWADMIREVILTDRMPPWHADPKYGHFKNDRRMKVTEQQQLIHWIEAGALQDEAEDPLPALATPRTSEWQLGDPDVVVSMGDPFQVPAEGVLEYKMVYAKTDFGEDKWIRGLEVMPGNRKVVHHALIFIEYPEDRKDEEPGFSGGARGFFGGFVPGVRREFFPEGTAKYIPNGATLVFQIHYVTTGTAQEDETRIGLHFYDGIPKERMVTRAAYVADFEIPPGVKDYPVEDEFRFFHDARVWAFNPHMHYRGSRVKYNLLQPDGHVETLLSVPNYNFDWQTQYRLAEPLEVKRGTTINISGAFNNAATNPYNPDPKATVHFGDQTYEEMFIGYIEYSAPLETYERMRQYRKENRGRGRRGESRPRPEPVGDPLTYETIKDTYWDAGEWKLRFRAENVLMVNDLIKGKYEIKDGKLLIDVVGEHFELLVIGQGLFSDGYEELERIE